MRGDVLKQRRIPQGRRCQAMQPRRARVAQWVGQALEFVNDRAMPIDSDDGDLHYSVGAEQTSCLDVEDGDPIRVPQQWGNPTLRSWEWLLCLIK